MVYDLCQESPFDFTVYHLCGSQNDVSLFSIDGSCCNYSYRAMDSAVLDHSFTDSGIREYSFRDCQVHTIPVFDIINVDISLFDVAISSDCGETNTGLRDSAGSLFEGIPLLILHNVTLECLYVKIMLVLMLPWMCVFLQQLVTLCRIPFFRGAIFWNPKSSICGFSP